MKASKRASLRLGEGERERREQRKRVECEGEKFQIIFLIFDKKEF